MDNNQINNNPINNQVNNNINDNKNNDRKGRTSFYGIIAIAVFIVIAIGTTFAYFTATARSGSADVGTRSAKISMDLISYGSAWSNDNIIPADTNVAEYAVEFQDDTTTNDICKDDKGYSVCSIYEFAIYSEDAQPITAINLITESNGFGNLHAMIYEVARDASITRVEEGQSIIEYDNPLPTGNNDPLFVTSAEDTTENAITITKGNDPIYLNNDNRDFYPIYINRKGSTKSLLKYNDNNNVVSSIEIPVGKNQSDKITLANYNSTGGSIELSARAIRHFIVVLYIKNLNEDQTDDTGDKVGDSNKSFTGQIEVINGSGGGVQGEISAANGQTLQSATPTPETTPEP